MRESMGSERARRLRRRAEIHGLRSARRHRRLRLRRPTPSLRRPPASLLKPELAASGGEAAAVNEYDGGIAVASYMYGERVHTRYDRLESEATRVGVTSPFTTFQSLAILSFFITHRPPPYLDTLGLLSLSTLLTALVVVLRGTSAAFGLHISPPPLLLRTRRTVLTSMSSLVSMYATLRSLRAV